MKKNRTKCLPAREPASALCLRKLFVPMDFSPRSMLALKYAHALAQKAGATLELLFVVEPAPFYSGLEDSPLAVDNERLAKAARKKLQAQATRLTASGVETCVSIRQGKAFVEICAHAQELKADLIVISTHGYSGIERVLMGSTAEQVIRRAPCPVLVLRLDAHAGGVRREPHADVPYLRRVLAPVDFSEPSRRTLNYAADFARTFGSHLTVFHASISIPPPRRLAAYAREMELGILKRAQRDLAKRVKEVVPASLPVNTEVVAGIPRNEILRAAERTKADLIVMATQGRRGFEQWFLGSTAEHTVRYAPCPVLVVRQPGPTQEQPVKRKRTARRRSD